MYIEKLNNNISLLQFYKALRTIDITKEEDDFERIEDWINGQPVYIKPALGNIT